MNERPLCAVILAAGAGTRMRSARPKPLHLLVGRPMVTHVLDSLTGVNPDWVVLVVGHGAERVVKTLNDGAPVDLDLHYVEQAVQRGTGDAVSIALNSLPEQVSDEVDEAEILILPGDIPLLEPETVTALLDRHRQTDAAATMLTVELDDPTGYGRVVRDKNNRVRSIVEERDATEQQREIKEVNTSVYAFRTALLGPALRRITDANASGEYYLTDVIGVLADAGHRVETMVAPDAAPAVGVNDRVQLAHAEAELRRRINDKWMRRGVSMIDPAQTYIDVAVELAEDVCIHPGVRLQGHTIVGRGAEIGPYTHLVDCKVGAGAFVDRTDGKLAAVGENARVGPFVMLQPGSEVAPGAIVGPFFSATPDQEG